MFDEDLTEFFDADGFGVTATFTPTSGSASSPVVIFDEAYQSALGIAATNPTALGVADDFPASTTVGGTLLVEGTTFTISERELQEDGKLVQLQLRR